MENVSLVFFTINDSKMLCVKERIFLFLICEVHSEGKNQILPADFEHARTHVHIINTLFSNTWKIIIHFK